MGAAGRCGRLSLAKVRGNGDGFQVNGLAEVRVEASSTCIPGGVRRGLDVIDGLEQ
jgi:hypothetical protein